MNLLLTREAEEDAARIKLEYSAINEKLGEDFLDELEYLFVVIETFPNSGIRFRRTYRQFVMKRFPYLVVCQFKKAEIIIHAVVHAKRHPKHRIRRIK